MTSTKSKIMIMILNILKLLLLCFYSWHIIMVVKQGKWFHMVHDSRSGGQELILKTWSLSRYENTQEDLGEKEKLGKKE